MGLRSSRYYGWNSGASQPEVLEEEHTLEMKIELILGIKVAEYVKMFSLNTMP